MMHINKERDNRSIITINDLKFIVEKEDRNKIDDVMKFYKDEQLLTWKLLKEKIKKTIKNLDNKLIDFVDIGCGSGFWGISVKKKIGGRVIAIDISRRAYEFTIKNAKLNNVNIKVINAGYSPEIFKKSSIKSMYMDPPYHIYPKKIKNEIPLFAKGGSLGFELMHKWLYYAFGHVADKGIIYFNLENLGSNGKPELCNYFKNSLKNHASLYYINILEPISSKYYLKKIYQNRNKKFVEETYKKYPEIHYIIGFIKKDGMKNIKKINNSILSKHGWQERINIHKQLLENYSSMNHL